MFIQIDNIGQTIKFISCTVFAFEDRVVGYFPNRAGNHSEPRQLRRYCFQGNPRCLRYRRAPASVYVPVRGNKTTNEAIPILGTGSIGGQLLVVPRQSVNLGKFPPQIAATSCNTIREIRKNSIVLGAKKVGRRLWSLPILIVYGSVAKYKTVSHALLKLVAPGRTRGNCPGNGTTFQSSSWNNCQATSGFTNAPLMLRSG